MAARNDILTAILLGGLIAGTLDIGAATLISGKGPGFICQFIAGGLLGKKAAFTGGAGTMPIETVVEVEVADGWIAAP